MSKTQLRQRGIVRGSGAGEIIKHGAEVMRFCLTPEETGGRVATIERTVSPNFQLPPLPHVHSHEDCVGFVLAGRLVSQLDGEVSEFAEGGTVFIPRGVFFRWWNPDAKPARALFSYAPGKFGNFFKEIVRETTAKADKLHDYDKTLAGILRIQDSYGIVRQPAAESAR